MENTTKTVDQETKTIAEGLSGDMQIGKQYYIRTVTYHAVGTVEKFFKLGNDYFVKLLNPYMINESGPLDDFHKGKVQSVDKMLNIRINISSIVDFDDYHATISA